MADGGFTKNSKMVNQRQGSMGKIREEVKDMLREMLSSWYEDIEEPEPLVWCWKDMMHIKAKICRMERYHCKQWVGNGGSCFARPLAEV